MRLVNVDKAISNQDREFSFNGDGLVKATTEGNDDQV